MELNDLKRYLRPEVISRLGRTELVARLVVEGFLTGLHRSPYHGFSVEFAEYRPYLPGDPPRDVDWKVYGKTDRLYVKEYEEETNLKAYIMLDGSNSMGFTSGEVTKFEYSKYLAASLCYLLLRQRDAVGLAVFREGMTSYLPPRSVPSYLYELLRRLPSSPQGRTQLGPALHSLAERVTKRGLVVVLSDLMDDPEEVLAGLKHLRHRKHEVIVFHILDPAELSFPFQEPAVFRGMEGEGEVSLEPWHIREHYRRMASDWVGRLEGECREHGIDYTLLRTSDPYDVALLRYLARRRVVAS